MCLDRRAQRGLSAHRGWVTRRAREAQVRSDGQPRLEGGDSIVSASLSADAVNHDLTVWLDAWVDRVLELPDSPLREDYRNRLKSLLSGETQPRPDRLQP